MNSIKIEKGAIKVLKDIILTHDKMDEYLNENDKEPCWDGNIILYTNSDLKAEHISYRVPVQVKGKNDERLINRSRITYPIEYKNLRNYFNEGGVCYFVIIISDDGTKTSVFYNMMTPIKLQSYLKDTEKKKAEQTRNIPLNKLNNNDKNELFRALLQFGHDSKEQGAGELVRKSISLEDMEKIDSIRVTAFSTDNEHIEKDIASGEICVFGHIYGSDIWKPFSYDLQRQLEMVKCKKFHETFGIDGVTYYNEFEIRKKADNTYCIHLSENLNIELEENKIHFKPKTELKNVVRDVKFLEAMLLGKSLYIGKDKICDYNNANYDEGLQRVIRDITLVQLATTEYGITINKRVVNFTSDNWRALDELVKIYEGKLIPQKETAWHMWWWDGKVTPIFITRDENGEICSENGIHFKKFAITMTVEKKEYKVPAMIMFKRDVWENLYDIEEKILLEELEKCEINKETEGQYSLMLVEILAAYDTTKNEKYYDVAKLLSDKLLEVSPDNEYWQVNKIQLLKRKRELSEEELQELEEMEQKTDDKKLICAVNILLDNKRKAKKELESMMEEDKEVFISYPIYNLLK